MTLLFTLGAPNDDEGNLSQTALDRLNCTLRIYNSDPDIKIICTGGFGEHFNRTALPHAKHAQHYLINNGIKQESLSEIIESKNTFDDLSFAKSLIEKYKPDSVIIISSDFHMERVEKICNKIGWFSNCIFIGATSSVDEITLEKLKDHEKTAIEKLMFNSFTQH